MLVACSAAADPATLIWTPAASGTAWDSAALNWRDGAVPTAWVPGAKAVFPSTVSGSLIEITDDLTAASVTFDTGASGVTLAGPGRLRLASVTVADATATNAVATEIFALDGLSVAGPGALALGRVAGRVTLTSGTLLAAASDLATANVEIENGATLVTLGAPAPAANLLSNPSFEDPTLETNSFKYVSAGGTGIITSWGTSTPTAIGRTYPTLPTSTWISGGSVPDGNHALIVQRNGSVTQAFHVATAGFYQLAFEHFRRRGFPVHALTPSIDGTRLPTLLSVHDQFDTGHYTSVPIYLTVGTHVVGFLGCGTWFDATTMLDLAIVAPLSASQPCRALSADSSVSLAAGAAAVLDHTGDLPLALLDAADGTVTGSGTWSASSHAYVHATTWQPATPVDDVSALLAFTGDAVIPSALARHLLIAAPATLSGTGVTLSNLVSTFDATPRITALAPTTLNVPLAIPVVPSGNPDISTDTFVYPVSLFIDAEAPVTITSLANHRYAAFVKTGPAAVTLAHPLDSAPNSNRAHAGFVVYDGELILPSFTTNAATSNDTFIHALPARAAALTLTETSWFRGGNIVLGGDGSPSLNILATVTNTGRTLLHAPVNTLYVGPDATYSTVCLARDTRVTDTANKGALLKIGAGTLDVRDIPPSTDFSGYLGQTVIRAGAIRIFASDDPSGNGGSLGRAPVSTPIQLGDALTTAADTPTLTLTGNAALVAHDILVADTPATLTALALDNVSEARFSGSVTLHAPLTLRGPADAAVTFGTLAAEAAAPQPLTLDGIAQLTLDTATGVSLDLGTRALLLSPGATTNTAFHALTADGAALTFDFSSGNDTVTASALILSNLTVTLRYAGTDLPFAEPGTRTLFTAPDLAANPAAFTVANPVEGFTYTFGFSGNSLVLTIGMDPGTSAYFWANPASGAFSTAANWLANAVPDGTVNATLGAIITQNATVSLTAPAAVDILHILHPDHHYTLSGGAEAPLTLGGLSVDVGTHTVNAVLQPAHAGSLPITLATGAALTFANATLQGGLAGNCPATLAGTTALTLAGSGFTATHSGALTGTGTLTLNASGATQTLANRDTITQPPLVITAGTLALDAAQAGSTASVAAGGTLAVVAPATNGLTAFWYTGTLTNAILSRAALEAAAAGTPAKIDLLSGADGLFSYSDLRPLAPRNDNWLLVLRGSIDIPESDSYLFYLETDDYGYLAIDDREIAVKTPVGTTLAHAGHLSAGRHDILIGLAQITGAAYLRIHTSRMFSPKNTLPAVWLTPLSSLSTADGAGSLSLASGTHLRLTYGGAGYPQTGGASSAIAFSESVRPVLTGAATSVFSKLDTLDIFKLTSAAPEGFAGLFVNGAGRTTFVAPGILAPSARLALYADAVLTLAADQTAAALSGAGGLALTEVASTVLISNDADCDISADKTYTHAIDFGSNTGSPVGAINGVPFLSTKEPAGTCTGTDGATYGFSGMPPSSGNAGNGSTAASGNLHKLLYDMNYDGRNSTFALTGLNPTTTYELRIYQRCWGGASVNTNRIQLLGFIANDENRIDHAFSFSADAVNHAYYVAYRYRPSPSGALRVRLTPYMYNNTLHLYGLTNEEIPAGATAASPSTTLTLAPSAAAPAADYAGRLTGSGAVTVNGSGTQIFSGPNVTPGGLAITGGAAALHAGASVYGPVAVHAAGALHTSGTAEIGGLTGSGALALGLPAPGDPTPSSARIVYLSNDASTGISPNKTYTHLYDLGNNDAATINGVAFSKVTANTSIFSADPPLGSHAGNEFSGAALGPVPTNSSLYTLLKDMCYVAGATPAPKNTTLTLSGLTPGHPYELRVYNRSYGWGGNRQQLADFCTTADGIYRDTLYFNPDALMPNALVYRYVPESTTLSIRVSNITANNGWHLYGLSNEDLTDPDAEAWPDGLTITVPAKRIDTFAGTLAGAAPVLKSGDGTLLLTGSSTANGAFTLAAGAFGTAFTNDVPLTTGPVTFAPGTAYLWDWSAAVSGGTLAAGSIALPDTFTIVAGGSGQPASRWPVLVSETAPITTTLESIVLQGFPKSVKAQYSEDGRILYLTNSRGTLLSIQ